jgi:hypothetical protein
MQDDRFWYLLFTELLARSPKDTRNMVNNITVADMGDFWKVTISGPKMTSSGFYDYAMAVNYNPQRTPKEARNYQWVERTIRQVAEAMGGTVKYEL